MTGDGSFDLVLAAAQRGEARAFEQLYESMQRRVCAFASVRGAHDPAGLVNDVFLKVFAHLDTFTGNESQFSGWVFKIARNQLIDEARRRARRVDESELIEERDSGLAPGDVELEVLARIGDGWVASQLSVLTDEQRDVVMMRVVSNLTIEEIASALGKRVGAVKAMQRRAFQAIARNIERQAVPQ